MHNDGERYSKQQLLFSFYWRVKNTRQNAAQNICIAHHSICFYLAPWFLCLRTKWLPHAAAYALFASVFLIFSQCFLPHFRSISNYLQQHHAYALHNYEGVMVIKAREKSRRNETIRSK